jgi:hypothetical protein
MNTDVPGMAPWWLKCNACNGASKIFPLVLPHRKQTYQNTEPHRMILLRAPIVCVRPCVRRLNGMENVFGRAAQSLTMVAAVSRTLSRSHGT